MLSASARKPLGRHRCYSCAATVSANKWLCFACAQAGEESMSLIVKPRSLSNVGQNFIWSCTSCEQTTVAVIRDPGLLPLVWPCRKCYGKGAAVVTGRVSPGPGAPKPAYEFFRPRGLDYHALEPAIKELVDQGVLDERLISETLVHMR